MDEDDVLLVRLEQTAQRLTHNLMAAPVAPSEQQVVEWEELLERAVQVRIRLQQRRAERRRKGTES